MNKDEVLKDVCKNRHFELKNIMLMVLVCVCVCVCVRARVFLNECRSGWWGYERNDVSL